MVVKTLQQYEIYSHIFNTIPPSVLIESTFPIFVYQYKDLSGFQVPPPPDGERSAVGDATINAVHPISRTNNIYIKIYI